MVSIPKGRPNTHKPSRERQAALEAAYESQQDSEAPYKDLKILTLGELQWILQQRQWSTGVPLPAGMQRANLSGTWLYETNLSETNLEGTNLTATEFKSFWGLPSWPALGEEEPRVLQQEVEDPSTSSERLRELAWNWPGVSMQSAIAANPNTPSDILSVLLFHAPIAFLRNPALPLLFLENPRCLSPKDAQLILQAFAEQQVPLSPTDNIIVRLIEHCAHI